MSVSSELSENVLVCIRRIIQSVDLHSRFLEKSAGLTGPQLHVLLALGRFASIAVGELAQQVNLSHATVTGILERLERKGFVQRSRGSEDRRRVLVKITPTGRRMIETAPPMLQESFLSGFNALEPWEKTMILSSLQRIVRLMDAESIQAAPILAAGPLPEFSSESPAQADDPLSAAVPLSPLS